MARPMRVSITCRLAPSKGSQPLLQVRRFAGDIPGIVEREGEERDAFDGREQVGREVPGLLALAELAKLRLEPGEQIREHACRLFGERAGVLVQFGAQRAHWTAT